MSILSRLFGRRSEAPPPRHAAPGMISLVALCPRWSRLDVGEVRENLDALFPGSFLPPKEEANFVVEGPVPGSSVFVQCSVPAHSGAFLIYHVAGPYSDVSEFLAHVEDSDLRDLAVSQPCWFSVDLLRHHDSVDAAKRFISVALANLAPPDASLIVHPTRFQVARFSWENRQLLASGSSPFGDSEVPNEA